MAGGRGAFPGNRTPSWLFRNGGDFTRDHGPGRRGWSSGELRGGAAAGVTTDGRPGAGTAAAGPGQTMLGFAFHSL